MFFDEFSDGSLALSNDNTESNNKENWKNVGDIVKALKH